ncbi:hypothetical protein CSOJ01_13535 [Colletotrichum sojae]|uniref:Uncharacterized protein n=1 Tax=Colletotrichum sojae TaxID=2175907 RepID=A0A8H6ISK4_9PEZI|nr:hypothetical protein CSOJ01_13535 [Colletotrichum sojae]
MSGASASPVSSRLQLVKLSARPGGGRGGKLVVRGRLGPHRFYRSIPQRTQAPCNGGREGKAREKGTNERTSFPGLLGVGSENAQMHLGRLPPGNGASACQPAVPIIRGAAFAASLALWHELHISTLLPRQRRRSFPAGSPRLPFLDVTRTQESELAIGVIDDVKTRLHLPGVPQPGDESRNTAPLDSEEARAQPHVMTRSTRKKESQDTTGRCQVSGAAPVSSGSNAMGGNEDQQHRLRDYITCRESKHWLGKRAAAPSVGVFDSKVTGRPSPPPSSVRTKTYVLDRGVRRRRHGEGRAADWKTGDEGDGRQEATASRVASLSAGQGTAR